MIFTGEKSTINPDPVRMLWHFARGETACWRPEKPDEIGWLKYSHRGVQFLEKVEFPRKEKRYIFSSKFDIRYNQAFERVVSGCAQRHDGRTWITPELFEGYVRLHRLGYAHSYEAWQEGELVGGAFGIQIGGYITCESMFYRVGNASKAAWGQTLLYLKERGFEWIDTNRVSDHRVNYGEEWVPQWKFEGMVREAMKKRVDFGAEWPCRPAPWQVRLGLPLERAARAAGRRVKEAASGVMAWRRVPGEGSSAS